MRNEVIPQFRMRITHYFLLTAVCSILASIRISWIDWNQIASEDVGTFRLYSTLASLLYGAAFTALLILIGRRWRFGQCKLQSPGHWLLVFFATVALIQGLTEVLLLTYRSVDSSRTSFDAWNLEKLVLCLAVGITCLVFSWLISGNLWWRSILILAGVVLLILVPQHILVLLGTWRPWFVDAHVYASMTVSAAILPLLLVACLSDYRFQPKRDRDWLHWAGVFVTAFAALTEFCFALPWLWKR